jgi:hypothetical protein
MSTQWHVIASIRPVLPIVIAVTAWAMPSEASEPNLESAAAGQAVVHPGDVVTFEVRYSNSGPDGARTPYFELAIQSGLPAPIDQLTQQQFDDLVASAAGTDTLGNTPLLFLDEKGCESLFFQLQGPIPPGPVQGLDPGAEGSFSFDLAVPLDPPPIGRLVITEPAWLAGEFLPALTRHQLYYDDGPTRRYGRGIDCNAIWGRCSELSDCFGPRLSLMPQFAAELELVDDGGARGDPSLGCGPLSGFTAGRIAVVRRGECYFYEKALRARAAGAAAVVVVNDGRCDGLGPDSRDCVVNMRAWPWLSNIDIPVLMLSVADGEPIVEELAAGRPVSATLGASPGGSFELSSDGFLVDPTEVDCDPTNNGAAARVQLGLFADGFENGTTYDWSDTGD